MAGSKWKKSKSFAVEAHIPCKLGQVFMMEKGRALNPSVAVIRGTAVMGEHLKTTKGPLVLPLKSFMGHKS